jgi:hypothetical protein
MTIGSDWSTSYAICSAMNELDSFCVHPDCTSMNIDPNATRIGNVHQGGRV